MRAAKLLNVLEETFSYIKEFLWQKVLKSANNALCGISTF
jgi:hypothetical protein